MTDTTETLALGRMIEKDLSTLERIDRESFPTPWPAAEFRRFLERTDAVCLTARIGGEPAGYGVMLFEWDTGHILNLAVDRELRRRGVGRALVGELSRLAVEAGAEKIALEVRETNLPAQLFYREMGLRAVKIERGHYADTGEDAYVMEKPLREVAAANDRAAGKG